MRRFIHADSCFLFYLMVFKITVKPQCNNVLGVVVELANTDYIEITEWSNRVQKGSTVSKSWRGKFIEPVFSNQKASLRSLHSYRVSLFHYLPFCSQTNIRNTLGDVWSMQWSRGFLWAKGEGILGTKCVLAPFRKWPSLEINYS